MTREIERALDAHKEKTQKRMKCTVPPLPSSLFQLFTQENAEVGTQAASAKHQPATREAA